MKKKIFITALIIGIITVLYINFGNNYTQKEFNGFYVDTESKEVIKNCDVKIKIIHKKSSLDDYGKMCSYYVGTLYIDDKKYEFKGNTALNDNFDYYQNSEGSNKIVFWTEEKEGIVYEFDMYEGFKEDCVTIKLEDENGLHKSKINIIATTNNSVDDIINNFK